MKKLFAVLLALTLALSMSVMAFADTTGTITITNAVEKAEYSIYQMFTFTPAGTTGNGRYDYADAKWEAFVTDSDYLGFDNTTGTIEWTGTKAADGTPDATQVAALAKDAVAYAKAKDIKAAKTQTAGKPAEGETDSTVTFADLALGYYAIDTSLGTICALTNVNSTFTTTEKNEKPDLVKKIVEGQTLVDANNVNIGDTITYQATITIGTGAQNYVMHDKMSNTLEFKGITSVKVNDADVNAANYTVTTATATAPITDGCTFEIAFNDEYTSTLAKGTEIIVTYTAVLKDNAVVGADGNPNEAWLSYGDNHNSTHDFVITYTTKFVVEKVDGSNKPLPGAGFTLYKSTGNDTWAPVGEEQIITSLNEGEQAIYTWNGLEEGQYKLVETTVPEGYNASGDIIFTITCAEPTNVNSGAVKADWTVNNNKITETDDTFKTVVENKTGSLLPETGGIGTTIFYVVGGLLMVAAFILLVSKKRMSSFA